MTKFLDNYKFFKELRKDINHDLYIEMLKKVMWQAVEPNEFIFSKCINYFEFNQNEKFFE